jgi:hypothetical protein
MGIRIDPCNGLIEYGNRSNFNLFVAYGKAMAGTFLQFMLRKLKRDMLRELKWDMRRKISDFVVGLVPKPVRKIVGLILIIFGVVAMVGTWTAAMFGYLGEVIFMIGFIVSIASISWGIALLRHKG